MNRLEAFAKKRPGLFSLGTTFLCFFLIHLFLPVIYLSDDITIATAINGDYNGACVSAFPFVSALFRKVLDFLYRAAPSIAWYVVIMQSLLFFSCAAFNYCLVKSSMRRNLPLWISQTVFGCIFFAVLVPMCIPISFTMVAGICGVGAVALVMSTFGSERFSGSELCAVLCSLLLLVWATLIRDECGLVTLCFYALAVLYQLIRQFGLRKERGSSSRAISLVMVLCVLLGAVGYFAIDRNTSSEIDLENARWNSKRSALLDFESVSYSEAPEVYEEAGWNEEYYRLVKAWYLADDGFDTEALTTILSAGETEETSSEALKAIKTMVSGVLSNLTDSANMTYIVLTFVAAVLALVLLWQEPKRLINLLYVVCILGGMLMMWLYLAYIGRFRYHVLRMTAVQAIAMLGALVIWCMPAEKLRQRIRSKTAWFLNFSFFGSIFALMLATYYADSRMMRLGSLAAFVVIPAAIVLALMWKNRRKQRITALIAGACLIALCYVPAAMVQYANCANHGVQNEYALAYREIEEYAQENTDKIFIHMPAFGYYEESIFDRRELPLNLFCTRDFLRYTDDYEEKLARNGLQALTVDTYFEEDAYFVDFAEDDSIVQLLLDYMRTQHGDSVEVQVYEELDYGVNVYRFSK